jgi:short-subunit dehydrogenase
MESFKNKVVWITGASSGIGEALVYELASKGVKLVLSARREHELQRVANAANLTNETSLLLPFDLLDTTKASVYIESIINKFGRIDVLINNGGQSQRAEAIDTSIETEKKLFEINYFSAVNLSKAVLPFMIKQQSGKIIVISSIAGKFGFYLRSTYSAAKHALQGYFESLRLEIEKKGVSVLIVCPGKIKTAISLNAAGENGQTHNKMDKSHEHAMTAEACAKEIITATLKNKEELFVGGKELVIVKIKRFFPRLFNVLIRKQSPF